METQPSLMELLEGIHDPRSARGKRHPLPALLGLAVVAMLAGMTSYEAIVQYGKERGWDFLKHLGFTTKWGLCKATYSRVFRRIDVADFEARVGRWIRGRLGPGDAPHLCLDGKTARGSRDGDTPGVHLVSAYAPEVKAVLAQLRVDAKTNEHKAALELLGVLPLKGKVVSGDAMFTHRDVCAGVIEGGGDSVLPVKEDQPTLVKDIAAAFAEPEAGASPLQAARREAEIERACEVDKGHGRIEKRSIEVTSSLGEYLGSDWPGCAQVFRLTRVRKEGEKVETEVVLGITSLPRERAGAKELLGLVRDHWGIENGLHGVRDGTLREDASRIRKGSAAEVMAALRNIIVFLFKRLGHNNAAAATRHYVCHPEKSLAVLSTPI
jgi:predicted transposase YbfD/YdcC